jgi:uncharacterized membrane protein
METHKLHPSFLTEETTTVAHSNNLLTNYLSFVDSQSEYSLAWWIGSLTLQSMILPLTFLFIYTWNGPVVPFLGISMVCFFANVIANMGGASFRFRFNSFLISLLVHAAMIVSTIILTT